MSPEMSRQVTWPRISHFGGGAESWLSVARSGVEHDIAGSQPGPLEEDGGDGATSGLGLVCLEPLPPSRRRCGPLLADGLLVVLVV